MAGEVAAAGALASPAESRPGAGLPGPVGILALQGGIREHAEAVGALGADVRLIRKTADVDDLAALILPGGESSTIDRLTRILGLREPLIAAITGGLPTLGTCAGLILLAREIADPAPGQQSLGLLDVAVRRNAFGRQLDSAELTLDTAYGPVRTAFIRAPQVVRVGSDVEVIARRPGAEGTSLPPGTVEGAKAPAGGHDLAGRDDAIVGVRHGNILGISFHPELTGDPTIHAELLRMADRVQSCNREAHGPAVCCSAHHGHG